MKLKSKSKGFKFAVFVSLFFVVWWLINFIFLSPGHKSLEFYSDSYWVVGLLGAIYGLRVSKEWGGVKSLFGRSLLFFSFGLLAQVFGQITYSYFALFEGIEAPYPSVGDIGFFGSIILYVFGLLSLKKALRVEVSSVSFVKKTISVVLPILLLGFSYIVFLRSYEATDNTLVTLLDFGYPLGQAFYISLALLIYLLSLKALGGIMKNKILMIILALVIQYLADFTFLYRFSNDEWYAGGIDDLIYQMAYLIMTLTLLHMGTVAKRLNPKSQGKK